MMKEFTAFVESWHKFRKFCDVCHTPIKSWRKTYASAYAQYYEAECPNPICQRHTLGFMHYIPFTIQKPMFSRYWRNQKAGRDPDPPAAEDEEKN